MNKSLVLLAVFAALKAAAVAFNVGALPDSDFIDTESATNICFAAVSRGMPCDFVGPSSSWCEVSREDLGFRMILR